MSEDVVTVDAVSKTFGEKRIFSNVSVSVESGDFVGFVGRNGVGKTTFFNMLFGHEEPDSGSIDVCGFAPESSPVKTREKLGIIPEKESPPSYFTPEEYFYYTGTLNQLSSDNIAERITALTEDLGLHSMLKTYCKTLSRGQQQKVMIAKALLHKPDIVLIDEPVVNLDPLIQSTVKNMLREYSKNGNTILLSSHDVNLVTDLCDRGFVVTRNEFEQFQPQTIETEELLKKMKHNYD